MHDEGPEVEGPRFTIDAEDSRNPWLVARVTKPDDAAYIVRACNAHDDLVAALHAARQEVWLNRGYASAIAILGQIDAALAKAEA